MAESGKVGQKTLSLVLEIFDDAVDGIELARIEVAIGNGDAELGFDAADEVSEGEGVEEAGVEQALVRVRGDGAFGGRLDDLEDSLLFFHFRLAERHDLLRGRKSRTVPLGH